MGPPRKGYSAVLDAGMVDMPPSQEGGTMAWYCWFMMGAGLLGPWNVFITATDYFSAVYPGTHPDRLFTIAYLPTCLVMLMVMLRWPNCTQPRTRILVAYSGFTLICILMPLMDRLMVADKPEAPTSAFVLLVAAVCFVGLMDGISQGAVFSEASLLPVRYTHAVVGGTAVSGLIICVLRIITKAALDHSPTGLRVATVLYFASSAMLTSACVLLYAFVLPNLPIMRYYKSRAHAGNNILDGDHVEDDEGGTEERVGLMGASEQLRSRSPPVPLAGNPLQYQPAPISEKESEAPVMATVWLVVQRTWHLVVAMFVVYAVTLSIFPGFIAEDVHSAALGDWYPIILITVFNIGDFTGKMMPQPGDSTVYNKWAARLSPAALAVLAPLLPCLPTQDVASTLLYHSIVRSCVFIPLFVIFHFAGAPMAIVFFATFVLGLGNGFMSAALLMEAPRIGRNPEVTEAVMIVSLVAGLNVGAFCGWLWLL